MLRRNRRQLLTTSALVEFSGLKAAIREGDRGPGGKENSLMKGL